MDQFEKFQEAFNENMAQKEAEAVSETTLSNLMQRILIENQQRDKAMERMLENLIQQKDNVSQQNIGIMPELLKKIETFDGKLENARNWMKQLDSIRILHNLPDSYMLEMARTRLVDGARQWYLANALDIQTWQQFITEFETMFIVEESAATKWRRMEERTQKKGESIDNYFHEKVRHCKQLNMNFKEIKQQILIGLWSKALCDAMYPLKHTTISELLHDLHEYEEIEVKRIERIKNKVVKTKDEEKTNVNVNMQNNKVTLRPIRNEKGEWKCFNCNKYGHISKDCAEPKKEVICRGCKGSGHIQKNCTASKTMNLIATVPTRPSVVKYMKEVRVDDKVFTCLVDPGSSECTIKSTVVIASQFVILPDACELKGFGPAEYIVRSPGIVQCNVSIDGVFANDIELRIVPDDSQPVDMIIGRTFTELPHVVYMKIDDELIFKHRNDPFSNLQLRPERNINISSAQNASIPTNTVGFISLNNRCDIKMPVVNFTECMLEVEKGKTVVRGEIHEVGKIESEKCKIIKEMIHIEEKASEENTKELLELLNKYRECIATNIKEIGCTKLIEMDIVEVENSKPVCMKPYKASYQEREDIKGIVKEWKEAGIVRETASPYASPVLLVKKKTGESRLVVDFRRLNSQTIRMNFPLPSIDDHLAMLSKTNFYSVLDLAHGYLQVPLSEAAKGKTAFITPDETGEFERMIFGLTNAPFYFSKLMQRVLGPLQGQVALYYLDDILIPAEDWMQMKFRLEQVLDALLRANLTIKLEKCEFMKKEVDYLGFIISANTMKPGIRKTRAIEEFPAPKDIHEVRRFLGLASFFRRFIVNFAAKAKPMSDLLKKNTKFQWRSDEQKAFENIKRLLTHQPTLKMFNPEASETQLHTDASSKGLGAMLLQKGEDNQFHLVYAISRQVSQTEKSYHSSKLELIAIVWAVSKLRMFLINVPFTIITDCRALIYMNTMKTKNPQVIRWCSLLSEFDFAIKHRPGEQMSHVDALSRAPVEEEPCEESFMQHSSVFTMSNVEDELVLFQKSDERLSRKIDLLIKNKLTVSEKSEVKDYQLKDGILYKMNGNTLFYAVPLAMRKSLAVRYHDMSGHFGTDKTVQKISKYYHFPKMKSYVRNHIRMCVQCILNKGTYGKQQGELHPIPPGQRPFAIVHMDHLGPFVTSSRGNKHLLVFVDNLTKFVRLEPVKSTNTNITIRKIQNFVNEVGAPERFITDRGTCFTAKAFQELCNTHGIKHTVNSPRHAQANGQVERVHRTILPMIRIAVENPEFRDWDKDMKKIERDLNTTVNKTTNKTPFELLYGYTPRFNEGKLRGLINDCDYTPPNELQEQALTDIQNEQRRYKAIYDRKKYTNVHYDKGDIVYMKTVPKQTGESTKLQPRYRGPLVITDSLPGDTYRVMDLRQNNEKRVYATTAHVSQLKVWKVAEDEGDNEEADEDRMEKRDQGNEGQERMTQEDYPSTSSDDHITTRGKRERRRPRHLLDYHLGDEMKNRMAEC